MRYDFLNFSDIILIFTLGLVIGMPLGWFFISKAAAFYTWLHYQLRVKRAFKPLGPLVAPAKEKKA